MPKQRQGKGRWVLLKSGRRILIESNSTWQCKILNRDSSGKPKEIGEVTYNGVHVQFSGLSDVMTNAIVSLMKRSCKLTPTDGLSFVRALPLHLRSGYLWASKLHEG